jgi:hypothetical protein
VFDATGAVTRVVSFGPFVPSIGAPFDVRASDCSKQNCRSATTNPLDERIDQDQSTGSTLQPGRPQENIRNRLNPNPIRAER